MSSTGGAERVPCPTELLKAAMGGWGPLRMGAVAYVLENGSLAHRRLSEVGGFKGAAAERNGSSVHSEDEEDCRRYLCFLC